MSTSFPARLLIIVSLLTLAVGCPLSALVMRTPEATEQTSTTSETSSATSTPVAATPMRAAAQPTSAPLTEELTEEMATIPEPSPFVTITMTAEQMTALIQENVAGREITGGGFELTIHDPAVYITDEYVELTGKASSPGLGDLDFRIAGVPVAEDGALRFRVTGVTVGGFPLPANMIAQIESGLDQAVLSQSLPAGYEVREVILSDGLMTLVVRQSPS